MVFRGQVSRHNFLFGKVDLNKSWGNSTGIFEKMTMLQASWDKRVGTGVEGG